jgi:probable F420-dependent oxidoreductase
MDMHFGATVWFTEYSISPSRLAVALEEREFESLWASEHSHLPIGAGNGEPRNVQADVMDPLVTLTAAAMSTQTLKLGTGICLVNQRDPIQTAKLVASIDRLSGGRFLFGIGNGWHEEEMRNHGTAFTTRHQLVQDRVEAMRAIWTQEKAEYHGEFVSFGPMIANPKPVLRIPTMPPGHTEVEASTCSDLMPSTVLMRWRPSGVVSVGRLGSCHE